MYSDFVDLSCFPSQKKKKFTQLRLYKQQINIKICSKNKNIIIVFQFNDFTV